MIGGAVVVVVVVELVGEVEAVVAGEVEAVVVGAAEVANVSPLEVVDGAVAADTSTGRSGDVPIERAGAAGATVFGVDEVIAFERVGAIGVSCGVEVVVVDGNGWAEAVSCEPEPNCSATKYVNGSARSALTAAAVMIIHRGGRRS